MENEEKVRITVTVDRASADKIQELAGRMNTSHSRMASMLLEAGLENNEWIIRIVTSRVVKGLSEALGMKPSKNSDDAAMDRS